MTTEEIVLNISQLELRISAAENETETLKSQNEALKEAVKKALESIPEGQLVIYDPNDVDYTVRPKLSKVKALVVNKYEREFTLTDDKGNKRNIKREEANLLIFHDGDVSVIRKQRVPHKDDALEGESFYQ